MRPTCSKKLTNSLGVTAALIAAGVLYSLWKTRGDEEEDWPSESDGLAPVDER